MVQPQMSMMQQPVTMQVIPTTGKDRQQVIMITFLVKSISQNPQPNVFQIISVIFRVGLLYFQLIILDHPTIHTKQARAELCQAQGKFRRVRVALDLYLIDRCSYDFGPEIF